MFTRNCPDCGKELSYVQKCSLYRAIRNNKTCISCSKKGGTLSEEHRRKLSEANKGHVCSVKTRRKISIRRGGSGKLDQKFPKHRTWAKRVKERDGCCQKCSSTENLHAHHLMPKALLPQYADVVANGITLCQPCHVELHKILCQN